MKISVFGLGYVGAVSAACLTKSGHTVIGVDPNSTKVSLINEGKSPIIEEGIDQMIGAAAKDGLLKATQDAGLAVMETDISLVCVGTPSQANGNLDLTYIRRVCAEIGAALARKKEFHIVVIRSTMLPGSMKNTVIPVLEDTAGPPTKGNYGVCINPEFLREGDAVYDYFNPPKTLIGEQDDRSGDVVAELYKDLDAPLIRTSIEVAEITKYIDNSWHALKVAFGNEVGAICKPLGIDSHDVMDIFTQDRKLNISATYFKPGFAFGGSCLPKDLRAINYKAKSLDLDIPLFRSILPSNRVHIDRAIEMVQSAGSKNVSILGLSFKAGTDDLRESPIVEMTERLLGKGYDIQIYDRNVQLARLTGANRDYLLNHVPHISNLLVEDIEEVLRHGETVVIANSSKEFSDVINQVTDKQKIVDLVRLSKVIPTSSNYEGIGW